MPLRYDEIDEVKAIVRAEIAEALAPKKVILEPAVETVKAEAPIKKVIYNK